MPTVSVCHLQGDAHVCQIESKKTKINSAYSSWEGIIFGISQGLKYSDHFCLTFLCDVIYFPS